MATAENIQTVQGFVGYFDPAQAERMVQGCGFWARGAIESKGDRAGKRRTEMAIAANIRTMQGFLGYFDPAQAGRMARGCRVHARRADEGTKVDYVITERADGAIAANIRTMQGFLGYFDPAQAERMARGCRVELPGDWPSQALSALQDAFRDWEITIEEAQAEGDKVAVRFAVPSHQLPGSWAAEPAMYA